MASQNPFNHGGSSNALDREGLCLISLDGGSVQGLSSLYILKAIMDRLNAGRNDSHKAYCDHSWAARNGRGRMPLYALAAEGQLSLGRYEESLEQHKRILYVNSRTKDSGHSRQLKSQAGLASTYLLIVPFSQEVLARAYLANKETHKGVELLQHTVNVLKNTNLLHTTAPDLTLCEAYRCNGQTEGEMQLLEEFVARRNKLPVNNIYRIRSEIRLGMAYKEYGWPEEALPLLKEAVTILDRCAAEDNPDRVLAQQTLAELTGQSYQPLSTPTAVNKS
ncbi:hypothetical protein TEQG_05594 [Trichophyton equinum CBS 127.97]|uniref:MalT-like TPR region domain-containing protein n=1 Tax=Trichophyton equinum (strain ATCC MYA-4606 / CBS 127.97) TaxID=559882 RepID=F2PXH8_TRIEC|nr:hypothetical protein TEQG_05594 [Trichophyton equinum CBS 127.97]